MNIKIINGPNINFLEVRDFKIYGNKSITYISNYIDRFYNTSVGFNIIYFQSSSESKIVKEIHKSINKIDYFVINLAGLSYYSISILDALLLSRIPFLEVHVSNVFNRDNFRSKSIFSKYSSGFFSGMGVYSYFMAVDYINYLSIK